MGAGISSLSKICLVEPYGRRVALPEKATRFRTGYGGIDAARESAQAVQAAEAQAEAKLDGDEPKLDIDYTFVGLGIENDEVDVAGNCGNMSSAIGPYAYNAGLLPSRIYAQGDGEVTVKIRNTNTGKLIDSTFEVIGAQAAVVGSYSIDGVTGNGSKIKLDFKHPYGSKTGRVLPTGKRVDNIGGYRVSCVDGANPAVFVRADDVGVDGTILPNDFNKLPEKLALLESIRKAAAIAMGIASTEEEVPRTIPKIGLVSQSSSHPVLSGKTLKSSQMDIVIRFLSDTQPHRAIPLTAALTSAVAARIPGTIVEQMLAPEPLMEGAITIGHASGRLQVNATMDGRNKLIPVSGTVYRTAKRLLEGEVFWTDKAGATEEREEIAEPGTTYGSNGRHSLGLAFVLEHRGQDSSHLFEGDAIPSKQAEPTEPDDDQIAAQQPTLEQIEQNEQVEAKPAALSHRPLPDPHRKRPDLRAISQQEQREDALASALQDLHSELSILLSDEKVKTSTKHSNVLLTAILKAHRSIQINAIAQKRTAEKANKEASKKARSAVADVQRPSLKLTKAGKLVKQKAEKFLPTAAEQESKRMARAVWDEMAKQEEADKATGGGAEEGLKALEKEARSSLSRRPQVDALTQRRPWKNAADKAKERKMMMDKEMVDEGEENVDKGAKSRDEAEGTGKARKPRHRETRKTKGNATR
jgi:2-methylaconitate cis-trans-isomerase PrpF